MKHIYRLWTVTNLIPYRLWAYAILSALLMITPTMAIDMEAFTATWAPKITSKVKENCTAQLVARMNDPASFQSAGEWYVNEDTVNLNARGQFAVIIAMPMRGKNGYGGLVLKTALCDLAENDGTLTVALTQEGDPAVWERSRPHYLSQGK